MKVFFRWLSCLSFLVICGQLMAYMTEERISELEKQMQEVGSTNSQGTFGADFTSASPEVQKNWYLMLEPLYWHAKAGGTEYAFTDKDVESASLPSLMPLKGRVKHQEFGWEWGLRVSLGRHFKSDDWDVNLNYTWYQADDSTNVFKRSPSAIIGLKVADAILFRSAKSHHDLNYNNINLEIGRHYFMSSKVSVRPQFGLKSTWLFERQNVHYNLSINNGLFTFGQDVKTKDKSIFWGMGPRMGLEVQGFIGDGFSLYGKAVGALLYSYFRTSYNQKVDEGASNLGSDFTIRLRGNNHRFVPTAQMMLGLIWETYVNEHRQHITLGAGYEVEYYWRANQMMQVDDVQGAAFGRSVNRGLSVKHYSEDVMFYGLTLQARLDF